MSNAHGDNAAMMAVRSISTQAITELRDSGTYVWKPKCLLMMILAANGHAMAILRADTDIPVSFILRLTDIARVHRLYGVQMRCTSG